MPGPDPRADLRESFALVARLASSCCQFRRVSQKPVEQSGEPGGGFNMGEGVRYFRRVRNASWECGLRALLKFPVE